MCLEMPCPYSSTTFEGREKWISHLALDHEMEPKWDSAKCLLCKEETGSGKMAITRHLSKHLEEISLSALPVEIGSTVASENVSEFSDSNESTGQNQANWTGNNGDQDAQHQRLPPDAPLFSNEVQLWDISYDSELIKEPALTTCPPKLDHNIHDKIDTHTYSFLNVLKTHSGDRPYECPVCCALFSRLDNLRRHLNIIHPKERYREKDDLFQNKSNSKV